MAVRDPSYLGPGPELPTFHVDGIYREAKGKRPKTTPSGEDKDKPPKKMPRPKSGRAEQVINAIQGAGLPSTALTSPTATPMGGVVSQIKKLMEINPELAARARKVGQGLPELDLKKLPKFKAPGPGGSVAMQELLSRAFQGNPLSPTEAMQAAASDSAEKEHRFNLASAEHDKEIQGLVLPEELATKRAEALARLSQKQREAGSGFKGSDLVNLVKHFNLGAKDRATITGQNQRELLKQKTSLLNKKLQVIGGLTQKQIGYDQAIDKTLLDGNINEALEYNKQRYALGLEDAKHKHKMEEIDTKSFLGIKKLLQEQFHDTQKHIREYQHKDKKLLSESLHKDADRGLEYKKFGFEQEKFDKEHSAQVDKDLRDFGIARGELNVKESAEDRKTVKNVAEVKKLEQEVKNLKKERENKDLSDSKKLGVEEQIELREIAINHKNGLIDKAVDHKNKMELERLRGLQDRMTEEVKSKGGGKFSDADKKLFDRKVTPLAKRFEEDVKNTISDAGIARVNNRIIKIVANSPLWRLTKTQRDSFLDDVGVSANPTKKGTESVWDFFDRGIGAMVKKVERMAQGPGRDAYLNYIKEVQTTVTRLRDFSGDMDRMTDHDATRMARLLLGATDNPEQMAQHILALSSGAGFNVRALYDTYRESEVSLEKYDTIGYRDGQRRQVVKDIDSYFLRFEGALEGTRYTDSDGVERSMFGREALNPLQIEQIRKAEVAEEKWQEIKKGGITPQELQQFMDSPEGRAVFSQER